MAKLDEKLAKLDEQMAEVQEKMSAIKARKAEVLAQQREAQKRKHDRVMLLLGRVIEHGLKSETNGENRAVQLTQIRSLVDATFSKTNTRDRSNLRGYLDHLTETLEPLPQAHPDAGSNTVSHPVPQTPPIAETAREQQKETTL